MAVSDVNIEWAWQSNVAINELYWRDLDSNYKGKPRWDGMTLGIDTVLHS